VVKASGHLVGIEGTLAKRPARSPASLLLAVVKISVTSWKAGFEARKAAPPERPQGQSQDRLFPANLIRMIRGEDV
jgi:hypothetical protein